jgi:hypothetical protein
MQYDFYTVTVFNTNEYLSRQITPLTTTMGYLQAQLLAQIERRNIQLLTLTEHL